jgi:hypothetical protein
MDPTPPEKQEFLTTSPARRLTDLRVSIQFLSPHRQWSSMLKPSLCRWLATKFTGPIYQYVIGTFNNCSWGPINRSLIDTCGGYNLEGVSFSHTTRWPSQLAVSTFYLRVPLGLQLNHIPPIKPKVSLRDLWPSCGLLTTRPSAETYIYA